MAGDFILTARSVNADLTFGDDVAVTRFLIVPPEDTLPKQSHEVSDKRYWAKAVMAEAGSVIDGQNVPRGDILVFIHGYDNSPDCVLLRHRKLLANLRSLGYAGTMASFDWPSGTMALAYLIDRHKAKETAMRLVTDCISLLAAFQQQDCQINVHAIAHSTGAYVLREACDDADDSAIKSWSWNVSQMVLISGDISANSASVGNPTTDSLYRHCIRLTNYSNGHDAVLALSSAKRLGLAPRVGRVGLPANVPDSAVNVNCSDYFTTLDPKTPCEGVLCHAWQFHDMVFARDLLTTIQGDLDRGVFPTRTILNGGLALTPPP